MTTTWAGQPNGQIDLDKMELVEGFYFEPVTAGAVRALLRDARGAGYTIYITQGYRARGNLTDPYDTEPVTEWSAWNAYQQGKPLPGSQTVAVAAYPGDSFHGDGTAGDFTNTGWHPYTPLSTWLASHAHLYGIVFDIISESWHGHRANAPTITLAGESITPINTQPKEDEEMPNDLVWYVITDSKDGTVKSNTAYTQRWAGDALLLLDNGGVPGKSSEYTALERRMFRMNDGTPGKDDNPEALANFYTPISGNDMVALIKQRGLVTARK